MQFRRARFLPGAENRLDLDYTNEKCWSPLSVLKVWVFPVVGYTIGEEE